MTSSVDRTLAAQLFWEVSRSWNGQPIRRGKPLSVEQALKKLNRALEFVHSTCGIYWQVQKLKDDIIKNQQDGGDRGEEEQAETVA